MVEVALQGFSPFTLKNYQGFGPAEVQPPVGKFSPDGVTQPVGPVQETPLEYPLVQPGPVKTGRQADLNIPAQGFVRRSRIDSIRVEALVQDQAHEPGPVVEIYFFAPGLDFPQAEITLDSIPDLSGRSRFQLEDKVIEIGFPDFPELRVSNLYRESRHRAGFLYLLENDLPGIGHRER